MSKKISDAPLYVILYKKCIIYKYAIVKNKICVIMWKVCIEIVYS